MSKAAKIRELYALGLTTREIADRVGCRTEYVRVCARQRRDGGLSRIDKRYLKRRYKAKTVRDARRQASAERRAWMTPEQKQKINRKAAANAKLWRQTHPARWREIQARYRAKKSAAIQDGETA